MSASDTFLSPSEAARHLGISVKALRVYEARGLLEPVRTQAGWRAYGPEALARASEIVGLRRLGLDLAEIGRLLGQDADKLAAALGAQEARLAGRARDMAGTIVALRRARARLGRTKTRDDESAELPRVAFDLPWPWAGEPFALGLRPITYLTGPLGSGKTRLARRIAEALPGATFLPIDRVEGRGAVLAMLECDATLSARVALSISALEADGASRSDDLSVLLAGFEAGGPGAVVVDMVEQGLDAATQAALVRHLRRRGPGARPLVLMTRSTAILDLAALGPDEAILYCPANHAPPMLVDPHPGAAGYEALASCLAPPDVRARTEGMRAWLPRVA